MMNLSDFLSEHELDLSEKSAPDSPGETLTVIMLGVSEDRVRFGHFGIVFEVDRSAVLGVRADPSPTPNPFGKGVACSLVLSRDAVLTRTLRVSVAELLGNLPFGISRPSQIPVVPAAFSMREEQWLRDRGLQLPGPSAATTTYTRTDSAQVTATHSSTQSNGLSDDSAVDDTPSDPMPSDDANADDMANDLHAAPAAASTYTRTDSAQTTATSTTTQSNGLADDSAVDDSPSDGMTGDDASVDD